MILAAGADEIGRRMKAAGHRISLANESSMVATAARTGDVARSNDVMDSIGFLPNPLLPRTRSELAVPLIYNHNVIGVFDIQSEAVNRFTPEDETIQQILAGQVATAMQNAISYESAQLRASQLAIVSEVATQASNTLDLHVMLQNVVDLAKQQFDLYHAHIYLLEGEQLILAAGSDENGRRMHSSGHHISYSNMNSIVASAARSGGAVRSNDVTSNSEFLPNPLLPRTRSELAVPLLYNHNVIGVFDIQDDVPNRFDEEDEAIQEILAGQIAVAIQNSVAFQNEQTLNDENRRRARELEAVAQVSAATSTILDTPNLLKQVSDLTKEAFDLYHAHIYLFNPDDNLLELAAGAGAAGDVMKANHHSIPLSHGTSIVAQAARDRVGIRVYDVASSPTFLPMRSGRPE
jgi:GAF domain-containing protein